MTSQAGPSAAVAALSSRLRTVQDTLGTSGPRPASSGEGLFDALVDLSQAVGDSRERAWLLIVGLAAALPAESMVRTVARAIALSHPDVAAKHILDSTLSLATLHGSASATLRVCANRPLMDVSSLVLGERPGPTRRILGQVAAEWTANHDVQLVVWTRRQGAFRPLHANEQRRLRDLSEGRRQRLSRGAPQVDAEPLEIVVPWGVPVIALDIPPGATNDRLAALAELTSSSMRLVGHDCVPVSSAEVEHPARTAEFGRYLELVKHADRVAAVSGSAAAEFAGFGRALGAQGLPGPTVISCPWPTTLPAACPAAGEVGDAAVPPRSQRPIVVALGNAGPRDGQTQVLQAAELLWREGLDFELRLLRDEPTEDDLVHAILQELQRHHRSLAVSANPSASHGVTALSGARCAVFASRHSGHGLPVVEALSVGVPVITSDFGAPREVAEGQGGLLVDPTDVDALAEGIRALVTDDELHAALVAQAEARPRRTSADYATELWTALLG